MTLILHMRHYGTEEQSLKSTREMLRHLEVRGYGVINASHNGTNVEAGEPS